MSDVFLLRNTSYNIKKPRDLDSQLQKTVYCGLEGLQLQYGNNYLKK